MSGGGETTTIKTISEKISEVLTDPNTNMVAGGVPPLIGINNFFSQPLVPAAVGATTVTRNKKVPQELLKAYFEKIKTTAVPTATTSTAATTPQTFEDYKNLFETKKKQEEKIKCVNFGFPKISSTTASTTATNEEEITIKDSATKIFNLLKNDKNAVFISNCSSFGDSEKEAFITQLNTYLTELSLKPDEIKDILSRIIFLDNSDPKNTKRLEVKIKSTTVGSSITIEDGEVGNQKDIFSIAKKLKEKDGDLKPIVNLNDLNCVSEINFNENLGNIILTDPEVYAEALVQADKLNPTSDTNYKTNLDFLIERFKEFKELYKIGKEYEKYFTSSEAKTFLQKIETGLLTKTPTPVTSPTLPVPAPINPNIQDIINDPNSVLQTPMVNLLVTLNPTLKSDTIEGYFNDTNKDVTEVTKDIQFLSLKADDDSINSIQDSFVQSLEKIKKLHQTASDKIITNHETEVKQQYDVAYKQVEAYENNLYKFIEENLTFDSTKEIQNDNELKNLIAACGAYQRITNYYQNDGRNDLKRTQKSLKFSREHSAEIKKVDEAIKTYLDSKIQAYETATDTDKPNLLDGLKKLAEEILEKNPLPSKEYQEILTEIRDKGITTDVKKKISEAATSTTMATPITPSSSVLPKGTKIVSPDDDESSLGALRSRKYK